MPSASLILLLLLFVSMVAPAKEPLPGPIPARLVRVIDGDSVVVDARIWPGQWVRTTVRLAGIDTPELRSGCAAERLAGDEARKAAIALLSDSRLNLHDVVLGKYAGRVVARIVLDDGRDLGEALLAARHAVSYAARRQHSFC